MGSYLRRLRQFHHDHPRAWTFIATALLAGLSLVIGLGVTVYDGVLNPLPRARLFFIVVGIFAFYLPGLAMAAAAVGLRRGWVRVVRLGAMAAAAQAFMALVATFGQFLLMPFEVLRLIEGLLWTAADVYVGWRLWRALPWVAADAEARSGFEVEVAEAEVA